MHPRKLFRRYEMKNYDVIVVGGGFAGVAAAISAARGGAGVLLCERTGALGGAASNCLVNPFMRNWTTVDGKRLDLSAGIFLQILDEMERRGAMWKETFLEEELKIVLEEMAQEAGVTLLYHAELYDVKRLNGRISELVFSTRGGTLTVTGRQFIDATGDAQLSFLAGCETVQGRREDGLCQPMTLVFRVADVDVDAFFKGYSRLVSEYNEAQSRGEIKNPRENILVFKYPIKNVLHFNTTRIIKLSPTDPFEITRAEIEGRAQVKEMFEFLKAHADGFENAYLMMTAAEIGVRESRMIVGEHVLTGQECLNCTRFEDAIAACNYEVDIHNPEGSGTEIHYFKAGTFYTIPYRCLVPKGESNLLVAGRCISADHVSQASLRIMPTVCSIGEAAGTAAAMAVKEGVDVGSVNVARLREALKAADAILWEDQ